MSQVVLAKCPNCGKKLRMPAEWVSQLTRCKHCRHVFQAKASPERRGGVAALTPLPAAAPLAAIVNPRSVVVRKRSGLWKISLVVGLIAGFAGGVFLATRLDVGKRFAKKDKNGPEQKVALESSKGKSDRKKLEPTDNGGEPKIVDPEALKKNGSPTPVAKDGFFPRRALLISVSNYLLFNPLDYGAVRAEKFPGSSSAALTDTLNRPPLNIPATQIAELADGGRNPMATGKASIENAFVEFVAGTRAQDRIIVLFTGHAIDIENEAYLVPMDGNRDNAKTLIPLSWVYDKLAKCNCRQKLLILDVFRFPPARGEELPGTGAMTETFDAKLQAPPAGLQVWSSCIKNQQSIELESGSVFMQALCAAMQDRLPGIQEPSNPLPLDVMVSKVNQKLNEILAPQKIEQSARLTGTHVEAGGAPYNSAEPLPPRLVLKAIVPGGGAGANPALVAQIIDELNHLPPVRASQKPVLATSMPAFSAKAIEDYKADYQAWPELVAMAKDKKKYPLRAAVLEAIAALKKSEKVSMRESLTAPAGGAITPEIKKMFAASQKDPGLVIFDMENALTDLKTAGEARAQEKSKRWRANYDYTLARLQARLVYIYEYNYLLAQVRSDSLPELDTKIHNGWRVGSQTKVQVNEPKVKEMLKSIAKTWRRIREENPDTPWAALADREAMTALGLVWRPSRE